MISIIYRRAGAPPGEKYLAYLSVGYQPNTDNYALRTVKDTLMLFGVPCGISSSPYFQGAITLTYPTLAVDVTVQGNRLEANSPILYIELIDVAQSGIQDSQGHPSLCNASGQSRWLGFTSLLHYRVEGALIRLTD